MFYRHQTTEDYRMTSQAESDDEGEMNGEANAAKMSRTTIGIIGGLMTMVSAFAFYKAT